VSAYVNHEEKTMSKSEIAQSPEAVAYELMKDFLNADGKPLVGSFGATTSPNRADISKAFQEAIDLVNLIDKK
jgi:hypothetical protein